MADARTRKARTWTKADHEENARLVQADADRKLWEKLARRLGVRGRDLSAAIGRLIDDRIAAVFSSPNNHLLTLTTHAADADSLRGALSDLISDDVAEIFQILSGQETNDQSRDTEETSGSGEPDATFEQREIYEYETEETEE